MSQPRIAKVPNAYLLLVRQVAIPAILIFLSLILSGGALVDSLLPVCFFAGIAYVAWEQYKYQYKKRMIGTSKESAVEQVGVSKRQKIRARQTFIEAIARSEKSRSKAILRERLRFIATILIDSLFITFALSAVKLSNHYFLEPFAESAGIDGLKIEVLQLLTGLPVIMQSSWFAFRDFSKILRETLDPIKEQWKEIDSQQAPMAKRELPFRSIAKAKVVYRYRGKVLSLIFLCSLLTTACIGAAARVF